MVRIVYDYSRLEVNFKKVLNLRTTYFGIALNKLVHNRTHFAIINITYSCRSILLIPRQRKATVSFCNAPFWNAGTQARPAPFPFAELVKLFSVYLVVYGNHNTWCQYVTRRYIWTQHSNLQESCWFQVSLYVLITWTCPICMLLG